MADYSKPDHWSIKAQKEGYPARSVYKLMEMDEKFALIKPGRPIKILDLGAAPGSWSLYLLRKYAPQLSLVAVDLGPLSRRHDHGLFDKPEFVFINGDFTLPDVRGAIESHGPYNLIISDAAPATIGNRSADTMRSLDLAQAVLEFAGFLTARGSIVIKVFQGGDTGSFLKTMRSIFANAKSFKPEACRSGSFETYFLGLGKK
jgi:23S rRNA (uridine2552-2'-O)-methyltransferase